MLNKKKKILIAGLVFGVTLDSLGPKVVDNLYYKTFAKELEIINLN